MKTPETLSDALRLQAIDWLLRLESQQCTEQDRVELGQWLQANPSHQNAYQRVQTQWQSLEGLKNHDFPARAVALRYRTQNQHRIRRFAAAALIVLAVGLSAFHPNGWLGLTYTYETALGGRETVALSDGSRLELNTGSVLKVHYNHWQRSVELVQGEAFFTVVHDDKRPFEVKAGQGTIRDIGTAFEVFRQADKVLVAVEEGRVEVLANSTHQLGAGEKLSYAINGIFLDTNFINEVKQLTAWRQGQLIFHNRRLDAVLQEISRYHDRKITLNDPKLAQLKVSGVFRTDNLDDLLKAIATILPVKMIRNSDNPIITVIARQ